MSETTPWNPRCYTVVVPSWRWVSGDVSTLDDMNIHLIQFLWSVCLQGFTYVAPSVLENMKERFSFEPKIRSPRRIMGSPKTLLRSVHWHEAAAFKRESQIMMAFSSLSCSTSSLTDNLLTPQPRLDPKPSSSRRRAERPSVSSGARHGAVRTGTDGRHQQLRGLGTPPHPSARRGQPCPHEAASLPRRRQTARPSSYEPMTVTPFFFSLPSHE